jgi:ubiquinone/menaquinone biosynthesis C-methylase UbiE
MVTMKEPLYVTHDQARRIYDRIGRWQDTRPGTERRALDALADRGAFERAHAVLELGCGTGRFAERLLRERLPDDATYVGLDVSPKMVALARATVAPWARRARIELSDGSMRLPAADRSADRVVCTYVLDLLAPCDIAAFLGEARRVLRPGGLRAQASLAPGRTPPARLVTALWQRAWDLRPALVGGCRPIALGDLLDRELWAPRFSVAVTDWVLTSEVVVTQRA